MFVVLPSGRSLKQELRAYAPHKIFGYREELYDSFVMPNVRIESLASVVALAN